MERITRTWQGGVRLRTYLTALVLLPLLVCTAFAGLAVGERIRDAAAAGRAADLVRVAAALTTVQTDAQLELIPSMGQVVVDTPALHQIARLGSLTLDDIGLSHAQVQALRDRTDSALARLATHPEQTAFARGARSTIRQARSEIDSGLGLAAGYKLLVALSDRISARSHAVIAEATSGGSGRAVYDALQDVELTSAANQAAADELPLLAGYQFHGLGDMTEPVARQAWTQSWGEFGATSAAVLANATGPTVRQWRAALHNPASASFDRRTATYATNTAAQLDLRGVVALFHLNSGRAAALTGVQVDAVSRAAAAAATVRAAATRAAVLIGLLALLVLGLSVGVGAFVRRSIATPLRALARQAESVSRGDLVDVAVDGPLEVRTVADGLSAAVDNLRRIEAQAAAVAAGELDSDTVREPLPGALGLVMHESVATIITAIRERDLAQHDLHYQATHDTLTGLPNRAQALLAIRHALQRARRAGTLTGLMFVDLDFFKAVNDDHGHAAGDEVLRVCAGRMAGAVRDSDTVFRLGGDEFVVLLEDTSSDFGYVALAERIITAISAPIVIDAGTAFVGASVGISLCQDASVDAERLLSEADAASYSAKQNGRGRVGIYDDSLRDVLLHRASTERAIRHALLHDEFELHYQPVVELSTARPTGFEALIRWHRADLGLCYPNDFIPIAEKSTLINQIGRWTLHAATAQLAAWDATSPHEPPLTMAVNVSGRHLASSELLDDVRSALDASGLDPSRLIVEITETVLVDDPMALNNMHELRAMGVVVAIDDFGTGYTSIGQLPKLPIDVLKIDRSFTASQQPAHQLLVRLIVEAAHAFGLSVVAEGIELAAQVDTLSGIKVDTGQGYFFARPEPAQLANELAGHETLPHVVVVPDPGVPS